MTKNKMGWYCGWCRCWVDQRAVTFWETHAIKSCGHTVKWACLNNCEACSIEAEIGSEEIPHPVDKRCHTCAWRES